MELLTTKQVSEILGVSRRRVIALIEQGKLRANKFASVYMIAQKDLE
ncbi:MAG: helix-turn-helix domain-containing protein, partial [Acidobacteriota bacterium]|nr:helix-turn-helix domain-containing protein [Acidobacteriota bacterium]